MRIIILSLLFLFPIYSQSNSEKLNLKDVVRKVIESNAIVQNAKLEILKADSPLIKNDSKYALNIYTQANKSETKLPFNLNNFFSGTKQQVDRLSVGIEKQFETGTYFNTEVSTLRFDANAFENSFITPSQFSFLGIKPLHTGAVSFKISQELWKYSFGQTEKYKKEQLKKQSLILRDNLINQLIQIVTGTLIEYWSLSIADGAVKTSEKLYNNAESIRKLTIRKQSLGIAERFEQSQWSSLVESFSGKLENAKLERDEIRRRLKRILGVDPYTQVDGVTDLSETMPVINFEKDLEYAFTHRIDLLNLQRQIESASLGIKIAEDEDNPSIKLGLSYSSRAQSLLSPQYNFYLNNQQGIRSFKYPEIIADISVNYPLWDKGVKTNIRDSKLNLSQLKDQEILLKKEIEDELKIRQEAIRTSHEILLTSKKTAEETRKFYDGLLQRFSQGRFTALAVKNALDSLAQAELVETQAKINFNINLIRYDLAKNYLFEKYDIDVYGILEELQKAAKEARN